MNANLITLTAILRIPFNMHNVAEEQMFQPSASGMLGTQDPFGADFRACANFGPLYGKVC